MEFILLSDSFLWSKKQTKPPTLHGQILGLKHKATIAQKWNIQITLCLFLSDELIDEGPLREIPLALLEQSLDRCSLNPEKEIQMCVPISYTGTWRHQPFLCSNQAWGNAFWQLEYYFLEEWQRSLSFSQSRNGCNVWIIQVAEHWSLTKDLCDSHAIMRLNWDKLALTVVAGGPAVARLIASAFEAVPRLRALPTMLTVIGHTSVRKRETNRNKPAHKRDLGVARFQAVWALYQLMPACLTEAINPC